MENVQVLLDGLLPKPEHILQAGGFQKLHHSLGLGSALAAVSTACFTYSV